jgi:hypothetical protein
MALLFAASILFVPKQVSFRNGNFVEFSPVWRTGTHTEICWAALGIEWLALWSFGAAVTARRKDRGQDATNTVTSTLSASLVRY